MLIASSEHQASFFDVDVLCESLIPPESYYRKFRELIWPLLTDEAFARCAARTMAAHRLRHGS